MGNYINGYNKPRFRITDISGVLVEIIDLPICMVQGLTESYKKLFKTHELQNRALVNFDYKGERISFTLDYSSLIVKPTALQIQNLENYLDSFDDYKVYLYPRDDNLSRFFEVMLPKDYGYNQKEKKHVYTLVQADFIGLEKLIVFFYGLLIHRE